MVIFTKPGFMGMKSKKPTKELWGLFKGAIIFMIFITLTFAFVNMRLMPVIKSMAKYEANTITTKAINNAVGRVLKKNKVSTHDLLFYDYNEDGEIVSWNVNSIMINNLCTEISEAVIAEIEQIGKRPLKIPSGAVTGINIFSAAGPNLSMKMYPVGNADVDYKNELKETGINQVNHTVWLEIDATIQVMAPLSSEELTVQRKIVLVDKIISGKIPSTYVNIPSR